MYLLCVCKCAFTADGDSTASDGVGPTPAAPTVPRVRLNMNHLVFHKVLGKGSFGKVQMSPWSPSLYHFLDLSFKDCVNTKIEDTVNLKHCKNILCQ